MNKARGNKKDVNRILKAMKLQQTTTRYFQTVDQNLDCSEELKPLDKKIIYNSINPKKGEASRETKRRNYRYGNNEADIEASVSLPFRQQRSLQTRNNHNFFKISQKISDNETQIKNPYLNRSRGNSIIKPLRRSSQKPRRNLTQQSANAEPMRKTLHLKTIENLNSGINSNFLEQAKYLANGGSVAQSEAILQRILRQDPENKQALYLSGTNNFKQMNYIKSLVSFNRLLELDPMYNKNAYVMSSICYSNKGQKQQAMLRINTCLSYFPDYYDAHFQKAKLFIKDENNQHAIKSLKKALKLAKDPYECCLKLCECYQKQELFDLALKLYDKIYDKILKQSAVGKQHHSKFLCLLRKAQCQKRLNKFQQYRNTLKLYLKIIDRNTVVNLAKIYYQIGYASYKLQDYHDAIMNLEEVFNQKSKVESTEALILLTVVNIKKTDFYQAYHSLLRKDHLQIDNQQIVFYEKFCQGVLSLMKRKIDVGLQKLTQIQPQIAEITKDQFQRQIAILYPMYLSYAYFCYGRTDKCVKLYKKIMETNEPSLNVFMKAIQFNLSMCEGIQHFKHKKLNLAKNHFEKSTQVHPSKPQGFLYLGITLIHIYLKDLNENVLKRAKAVMLTCINNLKQLNNNYAASAFYVKSALSAFMGEWENSLNQIDQSIQRAEDNDSKAFYLRALILSCCQNFKQAVSQISIAISLNNKEPAYYLLRSKCTQIQGDGNRAFQDLQQYIALSPEDAQIHKYAGHLLFQNGAFEDAIQAYQNGEITADISNYDVFLTRSKTYFLLGNFKNCIIDMEIAYKMKPDASIAFDINVIKILQQFFKQDGIHNLMIQKAEKSKQQLQNVAAQGQDIDYGRIFKKTEITMLMSLFLFYMGNYKQSARQFKETIVMKQTTFIGNQNQFDEQQKQRQFFVSQMNYNRAVCYLMASEPVAAMKALRQCKIQQGSKTSTRFEQLKQILQTKKGEQKYVEIFNQKNKLSRMLKQITIKLSQNDSIKMKLSIPFPKVEPPQINPKFQIRIMRQIDIETIERKPEAPWIIRQQNSIKFTQKIQQFSRLQINNSQLSKKQKQKKKKSEQQCQLELQKEDDDFSQYNKSMESLNELRKKLKLDDKIQTKLNKILNKQK